MVDKSSVLKGIRLAATAALTVFCCVQIALADSCPYCGRSYGQSAPGDSARVNALRQAHESSCRAQHQSGSGGGAAGRLYSPSPVRRQSGQQVNQIQQTLPTPFQLQKQKLRQEADFQNEQGLRFAAQKKWQDALQFFRLALEKYPDYDDERQKLKNNVDWAEREMRSSESTKAEFSLSLQAAKNLVSDLQSAAVPSRSPLVPIPLPGAGAPVGRTQIQTDNKTDPKAMPRQLPLPAKMLDIDEQVKQITQSGHRSEIDRQSVSREYAALRDEFDRSWQPLSKAYREFVGTEEELQDLKLRIEAHNLVKPSAPDLESWNNEARLLVYQMEKIKSYSAARRQAFEKASLTYQKQVDEFLGGARLAGFERGLKAWLSSN